MPVAAESVNLGEIASPVTRDFKIRIAIQAKGEVGGEVVAGRLGFGDNDEKISMPLDSASSTFFCYDSEDIQSIRFYAGSAGTWKVVEKLRGSQRLAFFGKPGRPD